MVPPPPVSPNPLDSPNPPNLLTGSQILAATVFAIGIGVASALFFDNWPLGLTAALLTGALRYEWSRAKKG